MSDFLCVLQMMIVLSVMIDNVAKKIQEIQNDDFFSSWVLLIKHTYSCVSSYKFEPTKPKQLPTRSDKTVFKGNAWHSTRTRFLEGNEGKWMIVS